MTKLTEKFMKKLQAPTKGHVIYWDDRVKGFGVRITANEVINFVFNYRTKGGTQRRLKIGAWPTFSVEAARSKAVEHHHVVANGGDPQADREGERVAPIFKDLADYYLERHAPNKRTEKGDQNTINHVLLGRFGTRKVAEISFNDIDALHHRITKAGHPYQANRVVALLSKMFSMAIKKGWRTDNPAKGVERNQETPRKRYLSGDELARLTKTLDAWPDQHVANAIRLLLCTGARSGEVLSAKWDQFDIDKREWTKPSSHTKTKQAHTVPLSDAALAILSKMQDDRTKSDRVSPYLFPGRGTDHRVDHLKKPWAAICKEARITGLRIHDLRHSFASILVAGGASLPMIGELLGHTQVSTTQRYAHLDVGPLRDLVNKVGAVVEGAQKVPSKVVKMRGR